MKTDVVFNDRRWKQIPLEEIAVNALKLIIANFLEKDKKFGVSILASNDAELKELNRSFRGKNTSTNIISWPEHSLQTKQPGCLPKQLSKLIANYKGETLLGNLAISFERCSIEAKEKKINFEDHMFHLLLHGYLHLIGFDHQHELDANLMENIEIRLLSRVGIKNPYELID